MQVSVTQAKGQLTDLVRRAESGEEVFLTRHGHAVVKLTPVKSPREKVSLRELIEEIQTSAAAKATPGPSAARSQDFLYDENGLPGVIAVDTSALMAIILKEPAAAACTAALENDPERVMSAGTMAEALIVAARRQVSEEMARLIEGLDPEIITVTAASALRSAQAYRRWGKGLHPAALNYGDCFAYDVAKHYRCHLLVVGNDFSQTDLNENPATPSNGVP